MSQCANCSSHAINPECHGRDKGADLELCDVCYWRKIAENNQDIVKKALAVLISAKDDVQFWGNYADDYSKEKHDLQGSVNQFDGLIAEINGVLEDK